jgi:hypothetical protein
MDEPLLMCVLQGGGYLPDVDDDAFDRQARSPGMTIQQTPMRSIFHHQEWEVVLYGKIEQAHDMGMSEVRQGAGFL